MAEYYEKKVRKQLKKYGCTLKRRGKGDHDFGTALYQTPLSRLTVR